VASSQSRQIAPEAHLVSSSMLGVADNDTAPHAIEVDADDERAAPIVSDVAPRPLRARPSPIVEDLSREYCPPFSWQPSRQLLRALRDYAAARARGGMRGRVESKIAVLRHRFWAAVSGAEIPLNAAHLAGGLMIPHPNGVVVHPEAVIGPNCLLFQQVTIGTGPRPGVPRLGGHVDVGPGAKILGGVVIGDGAVIGANAVVLSDVPAGAVAVGIPAVIKRVG
jgi:serine O-acetyltransferase